jgi:hypothetical protein
MHYDFYEQLLALDLISYKVMWLESIKVSKLHLDKMRLKGKITMESESIYFQLTTQSLLSM